MTSLRDVGLLPDPADFGGDSYDDTDLAVLRAIGELRTMGMTHEILVALGRIYVDHFAELQRDVLDMLSGKANPAWNADELVRSSSLTSNAPRLIPAINQLLSYIHQRTLTRRTTSAARPAPRYYGGACRSASSLVERDMPALKRAVAASSGAASARRRASR